YAKTNYGDITNDWSLDFTATGQYDVIYNHILTHKYYINLNQVEEISMTDAIMSWFNTVYMPVVNTIIQHKIMKNSGAGPSRTYMFGLSNTGTS
ncbi:MAG: transcriptional regulator, partial [Treponema sp.]|nr:transcriptional regulator [Treponema sp.]